MFNARFVSVLSIVLVLALAACGDTLPGDLPNCDVSESDVTWSLDDNDAIVASWSGDFEATYLAVLDPDNLDDDGAMTVVFSAGVTCGSYLFTPVDALCTDEPAEPISSAPLEAASLSADVPQTGNPTIVPGRAYTLNLSLSDFTGGTQPGCQSFFEVDHTF